MIRPEQPIDYVIKDAKAIEKMRVAGRLAAEVLEMIAQTPNICRSIHMPVQSGSSTTLERMRRGYTREAYLRLIADTRALMPDVCLSTDIIAGFCGETEEEHNDTVNIMREVVFDQAFMFAYSKRDKTHASRTMV